MKNCTVFPLLFVTAFLLISGCSTRERNPVEIFESGMDYILPEIPSDISDTDRNILGVWKITFNPQTLDAEITPERSLAAHYNVRSMIPPPEITVNSYDPLAWVIDVDIAITNPYNISAYDVRGIIFTDDEYHMLLNPDAWTPLFDIPGGYPVNPFKAYAKTVQRREFAAQTQHSENYIIYLPNGNLEVLYAVDASYPSNCEEPYLMKDFKHDPLYVSMGSSARATVYVYDWQNNVNEVSLYCPQVTDPGLVFFTPTLANQWAANLTNTTGAPIGEYTAWLISKSSNSGTLALYDRVIVTISTGIAGIPQDPQVAGTLDFFYSCEDIIVEGNYAYVADSYNGVKIVDVSNPHSLKIVSCVYPRIAIDDSAHGIKLEGNLAYVANGRSGLKIIDVSDILNPIVVSELQTDWSVDDVFVDGDYAYISEGIKGFKIIDISDPYNPEVISSGPVPFAGIDGIAVENDIAYFIDGVGILDVYDVSDPYNPELLKELSIGPISWDIVVIDGLAYVAQENYLLILDVSDPQNPTVVSNTSITGWSYRIRIVDQLAYIASDSGLTIVDISDPAAPIVKSEYSTLQRCMGVSIVGDFAYIANQKAGVTVIDVSDPEDPNFVSSFGLIVFTSRVKVSGDYCYVACFDGMGIVDISYPEKPSVTGMCYHEEVKDMVIIGTKAYITSWVQLDRDYFASDFCIADISDPYDPDFLSIRNTSFLYDAVTTRIQVSGNYAYITVGNMLQIWDVNNPQSPQKISTLTYTGSRLSNLEILNDYAYVASDDGIYIVDISDPYQPLKISAFGGYTLNLILYTDYLISLSYPGSISIYDLNNPTDPTLVGSLSTGIRVNEMTTTDGFLYLACDERALTIVDIRDPANPAIFKDQVSFMHSYGIAASGRYAYLTYMHYCFKVIRLW